MTHDARFSKLSIEYEKLMNLASRSDFITVTPLEVVPGWPPEKYLITYSCLGISGIDEAGNPVASNFHQVLIVLGESYPYTEPYLKWQTPIWHPNIEHQEPHHVCTNNLQTWWAGKSLADLVISMGEMVQYKHYHARWEAPWPLDRVVAEWVSEYAEAKGFFNKEQPFDNRPLLREYKIRRNRKAKTAKKKSKIQFGNRIEKSPPYEGQDNAIGKTDSPAPKRIKIGRVAELNLSSTISE
jgi:ubiquitin-protein ligase